MEGPSFGQAKSNGVTASATFVEKPGSNLVAIHEQEGDSKRGKREKEDK